MKNGVLIEEEQLAKFVGELQKQISEMDFSISDKTTIILYTGYSNRTEAWCGNNVPPKSALLGEIFSEIYR